MERPGTPLLAEANDRGLVVRGNESTLSDGLPGRAATMPA
jgi:hypothetical protein